LSKAASHIHIEPQENPAIQGDKNMKTGLLTIGLIVLVLGAIGYFVPPAGGALYAFGMIIGTLLTILGLVLPEPDDFSEESRRQQQPIVKPIYTTKQPRNRKERRAAKKQEAPYEYQ
jgi:hypothetical protein